MRRTKEIVIATADRDAGKKYIITEMSAMAAEAWGARAILALGKSGFEIPDDIAWRGLAGVAMVSVKALASINYTEAKPLLEEMLTCIQIVPDPERPVPRGLIAEGDIEEVATLLHLREEWLSLHLGFSVAAALSNFKTKIAAAMASPNTSTSDSDLEP